MKCVKCGSEDHLAGALYCENCGMLLNSNYCTNDRCSSRDENDDPVPCHETACYCNYCGAETEYFRQGLVKPIDCNKQQPD